MAAIISLGLAVGAWATSWYIIQSTVTPVIGDAETTTYTFFWVQYTKSDGHGNSQTMKYTGNSGVTAPPNYPDIATTFSNSLAFLTAGAACLIATIVYQGLRVWCKVGKGSNLCRILGNLLVTAGAVLLAVSFFSFLNITKSFLNSQWPGCGVLNGLSVDYNNYNCNKALGNQTVNGIANAYTTQIEWRPDVGWWLLLASLFVSFFSVGGVLSSGRL